MSVSARRGLIIAAGRGSRLGEHSEQIPKSLISVGDRTIIEIILRSLQRSGIENVVIVTGYKHEVLTRALGNGSGCGVALQYVHNHQWEKKNGVSVHLARKSFLPNEQFLLLMSDHLFSQDILQKLIDFPLSDGEVALAVDTRIKMIFDIDDATKVELNGPVIRAIGKNLQSYNGVDCGLFKCTTAIFDSLGEAMERGDGDCSLTDGGIELAQRGKLKGVPIGEEFWIDVDTPESLQYAIRQLHLIDRKGNIEED